MGFLQRRIHFFISQKKPTLRFGFDVAIPATNCSYMCTVSAFSILLRYRYGLKKAVPVNFVTGVSTKKENNILLLMSNNNCNITTYVLQFRDDYVRLPLHKRKQEAWLSEGGVEFVMVRAAVVVSHTVYVVTFSRLYLFQSK